MSPRRRWRLLAWILLAWVVAPHGARALDSDPITATLRNALGVADRLPLQTGILYDRVLPLSHLERYDGTHSAPAGNLRVFRQAAYELTRASNGERSLPAPEVLAGRPSAPGSPIAILLLDMAYERLRPGALDEIRSGHVPENATEPAQAVLAAARVERTYHGARVAFELSSDHVFSNAPEPMAHLELDPGDGGGFRTAALGEPLYARYHSTGPATVRVRFKRGQGEVHEAAFTFTVEAIDAVLPNDTLHVTATEPWLGQYGAGRAYVRYGQGHTSLVNPVVVIEGFDLDNSMSWDELYALLDQQGLADTIWARGYDAVVLDFDEATSPIEENGLLTAELIRQVAAAMPPGATMAVVGASMGGLCSRYALAHLERLGESLPVRTWLSFDTPHLGANIPVGIQYWVQFFAPQSADAAYLLSRLDTPAAREMLVYHHTNPPSSTPSADPLRAAFLGNLATEGDWPQAPRRAALANGSGAGAGQGFAPGAQIIRWEYNTLFVTVVGDVWAVPDQTPQTTVFDGRIRILFVSDTQLQVPVTGTLPYDNAPGGRRATMTEMDMTPAPYGDIVALYPAHCFIPTVSAIALSGVDLFTPLLGNPMVPSGTPFAAVQIPTGNEDHVEITPEKAAFVLGELEQGVVSAPLASSASSLALSAWPQPFRDLTTISFVLPAESPVRLDVVDVLGRTVRVLHRGALLAGEHRIRWNGEDEAQRRLSTGLYFVSLRTGTGSASTRVVLTR